MGIRISSTVVASEVASSMIDDLEEASTVLMTFATALDDDEAAELVDYLQGDIGLDERTRRKSREGLTRLIAALAKALEDDQ